MTDIRNQMRESLMSLAADLAPKVATKYELTAPTVEQWCDWIVSATSHQITVADLRLLSDLAGQSIDGNTAANMVYKHQCRLGRETAGQCGY